MNAPLLTQAAAVTAKILLFRAGPQDFPHSRELVVAVPAFAASAYFAFWVTLLPPGPALVVAAAGVGALAVVTHSIITARGFANRFQQTFHALLGTTGLLALMLIPPALMLAPAMKQIIADPELLKHPEKVQASQAASFVVNIGEVWAFAIYAHIFRHATATPLALGVLIALFAVFGVTLLTMVTVVFLGPAVR